MSGDRPGTGRPHRPGRCRQVHLGRRPLPAAPGTQPRRAARRGGDDECDQDATADARTILAAILDARLSRRLTTVADATSTSAADRTWLVALAARHRVPVTAVVFTTPLRVCLARQSARPGPAPGRRWGRAVPAAVVVDQHARTRAALATLHGEGFARVIEADTAMADTLTA